MRPVQQEGPGAQGQEAMVASREDSAAVSGAAVDVVVKVKTSGLWR